MKSLAEAQQDVIDDFSMYDEWLDKYEYLIDLGKRLDPMPESSKIAENLIKGCQSRVWLDYQVDTGRISFVADSDAVITKGIISLLTGVYSGRTAAEIASDDFAWIGEIGLRENLSPTRSNGLASMVARIKQIAERENGK